MAAWLAVLPIFKDLIFWLSIALVTALIYFLAPSLFWTVALLAVAVIFFKLAFSMKQPNQRIGVSALGLLLVVFALVLPMSGLFSVFGEEFASKDVALHWQVNGDPNEPNRLHKYDIAGTLNRSLLPNEVLQISGQCFAYSDDDYSYSTIQFRTLIDNSPVSDYAGGGSLSQGSSATSSGFCALPAGVPTDSISGGYHTVSYDAKGTYRSSFGGAETPFGGVAGSYEFYKEDNRCADPSYIDYIVPVPEGVTLRKVPAANEVGFAVTDPIFCHTSPVAIQQSGVTVAQDYKPLDSLMADGYATVPAGQLWLVRYRGLPNAAANDIIACANSNGVWDATNNKCLMPPVIYYDCRGIITTTSDCITEEPPKCEDAEAVLDLTDGICYKFIDTVVNPNPTCPEKSELTTKNGNLACVWNDVECPTNSTWDASKKICINETIADPVQGSVTTPPITATPVSQMSQENQYLIYGAFGVMIIAIFASAIFFKKKRR